MKTDPRTIILADDGRYVTLGRSTAPTDAEVAACGEALAKQGLGGWLATMSGTFYQRRCPILTMLRPVAPPRVCWDRAVKLFAEAHAASARDLRAPAPGKECRA